MVSSKNRDIEARRAALAILEAALANCRNTDARSPALTAALDELAAGASESWPFDQFRRSLDYGAEATGGSSAEGRWQNVNASLNAIRRVIGL